MHPRRVAAALTEPFTDAERVSMYQAHKGKFDAIDATWACAECYEDSPCDVTRALDYTLELEECLRRTGTDVATALTALRDETGPRDDGDAPG